MDNKFDFDKMVEVMKEKHPELPKEMVDALKPVMAFQLWLS